MALSLLRPGGYARSSTITSAEIGRLDVDHANAADKTAANDTISGTFAFASGSGITQQSGSTFTFAGTNTFTGTTICKGTGLSLGDGGANPGTATVLSNGTVLCNPSSAFTMGTAGAAITTATGKLQTSSGGRLVVGDSDFFLFPVGHAGRTPSRVIPFATNYVGNMSGGTLGLIGSASATANLITLPILWTGMAILTLQLLFTPTASHTALPAVNITAQFKAGTITPGSSPTLVNIGTAGTYSPVSLADYTNGLVHALTIPVGNPTINTTDLNVLSLTDENGANSLSGNVFHGLLISYTVTDARLP